MLQQAFFQLAQNYSTDIPFIEKLWNEIEKNYSGKKRYYHNLTHLENMFAQLQEVKNLADDWDMLMFALFYHDLIYKVPGKDNEEKSARTANERLQQLGVPVERINRCCNHILATKSHTASNDPDTNLLTDADLSILGQEPPVYIDYTKQIRKEYAFYPDILYKPGRKKVVNHFLHMDRVFKTSIFFDKYEQQAKQNLTLELEGA